MLDTEDLVETGDDYIEFFRTGTHATGEYHCAACAYGITIRAELPLCPMCGGDSWEATAWSPFRRVALH